MTIVQTIWSSLKSYVPVAKEPNTEKDLLDVVLSIEAGEPNQKIKTRLYRTHAAIHILFMFGLVNTATPLAKKLLEECRKCSMHNLAASIADLLSRYCSIGENSELAMEYHKTALIHLEIYQAEVKFNWLYARIRNKFGKPDFHSEAFNFKILAEDLKGNADLILNEEITSVRLMFIYYELLFFHSHILEDSESSESICKQGIAYFNTLPFDHQYAKNVFTFHLIDTYMLDSRKLTEAELICKNVLDRTVYSPRQRDRYKALLVEIEKRRNPTKRDVRVN